VVFSLPEHKDWGGRAVWSEFILVGVLVVAFVTDSVVLGMEIWSRDSITGDALGEIGYMSTTGVMETIRDAQPITYNNAWGAVTVTWAGMAVYGSNAASWTVAGDVLDLLMLAFSTTIMILVVVGGGVRKRCRYKD
jgi:hypothetical protein